MSGIRTTIKRFVWLIPVVIIIAIVLWLLLGGYGAIKSYFGAEPSGVSISTPPPPADVGIPGDAELVPIIEDKVTITERLNPFHEYTHAEELTKDLLAGTEIYEVEIPGRDPGLIYRTPQGFIYELGDLSVTAYRTPTPLIVAEFRQKIFVGIGVSKKAIGIGFELDMLRIWRVHIGPAVGYQFDKTGWIGTGFGVNLWKNVDVGGYGGKIMGGKGWIGGVSVGIAIE